MELPSRKKVSYIGGHPLGTGPSRGLVEILDDAVIYTAQARKNTWHGVNLGWRRITERLEIPLTSIREIDSKTKRELQSVPQGYISLLPGIAHGYWQDRKHPADPTGPKLTALLTIRFKDDVGDEQLAAFGNWPTEWGHSAESLEDFANAIIAARYRARKTGRSRQRR
jgi:hypothetical protein